MDSINSHLPHDIRVCGIHPVSQTFDSKLHCDSRIYEYLLPTFMFKSNTNLDSSFLENMRTRRENATENRDEMTEGNTESEDDLPEGKAETPVLKQKTTPDVYSNNFKPTSCDISQLSAFKLSPEERSRLQSLLKCFEGSHFFHNYTIKKASADPSACRKIISFSVNIFYQQIGLRSICGGE